MLLRNKALWIGVQIMWQIVPNYGALFQHSIAMQWLILIRTCSLFGQVIQLQCDQMLELKTSPQLVNVAQKVANEALP